MSTAAVHVERELIPGVSAADLRDAIGLLDAWRAHDQAALQRIGERCDQVGAPLALLWLLAESVDLIDQLQRPGEWRTFLALLLEQTMTGEG